MQVSWETVTSADNPDKQSPGGDKPGEALLCSLAWIPDGSAVAVMDTWGGVALVDVHGTVHRLQLRASPRRHQVADTSATRAEIAAVLFGMLQSYSLQLLLHHCVASLYMDLSSKVHVLDVQHVWLAGFVASGTASTIIQVRLMPLMCVCRAAQQRRACSVWLQDAVVARVPASSSHGTDSKLLPYAAWGPAKSLKNTRSVLCHQASGILRCMHLLVANCYWQSLPQAMSPVELLCGPLSNQHATVPTLHLAACMIWLYVTATVYKHRCQR